MSKKVFEIAMVTMAAAGLCWIIAAKYFDLPFIVGIMLTGVSSTGILVWPGPKMRADATDNADR